MGRTEERVGGGVLGGRGEDRDNFLLMHDKIIIFNVLNNLILIPMLLLPGEEELIISNEDKIILTNQRIHMTDKVYGRRYQITIFLEDIGSIQNHYRGDMAYLVPGLVCLFIALINVVNLILLAGDITLGIIFLVLWLNSRRRLITISSKGGKSMSIEVEGMSKDQVDDFLFELQRAKLERVHLLYRGR